MSERMIVQHCSPTLAGMKTGNLFLCPFESNEDMLGFVRRLNKTLSEKGLRVLPLRNENCRTLIYVYRMSHLSRDLQHDKARQMLL